VTAVPLGLLAPTAKRVRAVLERRSIRPLPSTHARLPHSDAARRFWSERAWSEYSAVPGMSQTILALVREGGPLDELGAIAQISVDEVRHTELSRDLADALGGYVEEIPEGLAYEPQRLGDPTDTPLPCWIIGNACVSETVSLELMRARLRHTTVPHVRAVLERVLQDEAVHARMGWSLAERLLPALDPASRRHLAEYAIEAFHVVGSSFATAGLPQKARAEARRIREDTAALGLGACPPDEADHVCMRTITETIIPRFVRLGLPLGAMTTLG